jgi:cysteine-rich repeat protein
MHIKNRTRSSILLSALGLVAFGCPENGASTTVAATETETGDGDGDGDGDGNGDGDGDAGDGDGDAGDGDGENGDGDGDSGVPVCGDGMIEGDEECDDGNTTDTDACTNACSNAVCGDGIVQEGVEMCDDGNEVEDDECTTMCAAQTCGDGTINAMEECDDGNTDDTDACLSTCVNASCGDGFVRAEMEECDDGNAVETDECLTTCVPASCGDSFVQEGVEQCDDGNMDDSDACVGTCVNAACGDGFVQAMVEGCDDGNMIDDDACTNMCQPGHIPLGTILLGGTSFSQVQAALNTVGEPFQVMNMQQWLAPNAADILIMANDGGDGGGPDYTGHLNSGKHVLIIGGSGLPQYATYVNNYFGQTYEDWHMADDCLSDWTKGNAHPMTALLPDTYDFPNPAATYHMLHLHEAGQPMGTTLLGRTCHGAPNNYVLATREYQNGGTFTYMALDLGHYADGAMQAAFVVPFLQGYFDWLQMP